MNDCPGKPDSSLVFDTIGPYSNNQRPNFPPEAIEDGKLLHLDGAIASGQFNGIAGFPTLFYGFKRQTDGTFADPFKIAFNDPKGSNGPFGLSFKMNSNGTADFLIAWNNYFDGNADGGTTTSEDDKPDIYHGTVTMGIDKNLGEVVYNASDLYTSITPYVSPVGFPSHAGVQGNPHMYYDGSGNVQSIWTDDEQVSHNLTVRRLTSGEFPNGTWATDTLPSDISTTATEYMPFFTGSRLYFLRGQSIVYHNYTPTNRACGSTYTHNDCWGDEVVVLGSEGDSGVGQIFQVGEPTIATYNGKDYLYFVYVERRENTSVSLNDYNLNAGFVDLP